jgi:hypothetical protein
VQDDKGARDVEEVLSHAKEVPGETGDVQEVFNEAEDVEQQDILIVWNLGGFPKTFLALSDG